MWIFKNTKQVDYNKEIESKLSSEVLSKILGIKIKNFKISTNVIMFNGTNFIGTLEFAKMCKKWSILNYYTISSELVENNNGLSKIKETNEDFWGENEAVSVIVATNWIITIHLKNNKS